MSEEKLMETLKHYKTKVEEELGKFFDGKREAATEFGGFTTEAYNVLKDYTLRGGKRFRSTMCIMTYRGISGDLSDTKILKAAMSLEFMQSSLLTHDDIMDESKLRRGKPTPHVWIANWYKEKISNDEAKAVKFGRNMAIILGDVFNSYGIESILKSDFLDDKKVMALDIYNTTYETTGKGQILDVWFGERKDGATEEDYMAMIDRKTVHYTIEKPALLGAVLGGASEKQKEAISKFAFPIAQGFQIQDDILDCVSTKEKLGKPIGTDIKEGKNTLIALYAKKNANEEQMKVINEILGKGDATEDEVKEVVKVFQDTGALDYAKERARKLVLEGKAYLKDLEIAQETLDFYNTFADYLVERKY